MLNKVFSVSVFLYEECMCNIVVRVFHFFLYMFVCLLVRELSFVDMCGSVYDVEMRLGAKVLYHR